MYATYTKYPLHLQETYDIHTVGGNENENLKCVPEVERRDGEEIREDGVCVMQVKLQYIGRLVIDDPDSPRMWNVISPVLPGYTSVGPMRYPTLGIEGLREVGIL